MTTRSELAAEFESLPSNTYWKTFVIEAHSQDGARGLLNEAFGPDAISETSDSFMHVVSGGDDCEFYVDHLDGRFWSFHTYAKVDVSRRLLNHAVQRSRRLDWMWLPSQHLRSAWLGAEPASLRSEFRGGRLLPAEEGVRDLEVALRGRAASEVLALIQDRYVESISFDRIAYELADTNFGSIQEAINREGRFVARGESFELHQELVRGVLVRYRRFVEAVEERSIRWSTLPDGGASMDGAAIGIRFSRSIPDRDVFLSELFSSREPFRLWGVPSEQSGVAEVEAVDLHVGERLRFDIGGDWMRVYVFDDGCGNSVARLISNLQHHFDGALRLMDPELEEMLHVSSATDSAWTW